MLSLLALPLPMQWAAKIGAPRSASSWGARLGLTSPGHPLGCFRPAQVPSRCPSQQPLTSSSPPTRARSPATPARLTQPSRCPGTAQGLPAVGREGAAASLLDHEHQLPDGAIWLGVVVCAPPATPSACVMPELPALTRQQRRGRPGRQRPSPSTKAQSRCGNLACLGKHPSPGKSWVFLSSCLGELCFGECIRLCNSSLARKLQLHAAQIEFCPGRRQPPAATG